ncbi:MAG TPA: FMN-binding negative transcriptional regulator [Caulobacteraceae bacterium]|nr:FMN-binding negative transcriptional regulator [Caulobacteraceae bacterium]
MYVPGHFAEQDEEVIWSLIESHPFALLVTHDAEGFHATHMPFLADREGRRLTGHIARANPQPARTDGEAMIVFSGPDAYVSPNWYPSKAADGRAVPTWNYEAVHLYGRLTWRDEPEWKRRHLTALSERFERDEPRPWTLAEAPADYLDKLFRGLIGLEFAVERIEAQRKLSQNRRADNDGVIAGLRRAGDAGSLAIAEAMEKLDRT